MKLIMPTLTPEMSAMYLVIEFYERYIEPYREKNPLPSHINRDDDIEFKINQITAWVRVGFFDEFMQYAKVLAPTFKADISKREDQDKIFEYFIEVIKEHCL